MARFNAKSKGNVKSIKSIYQERIEKALMAKNVLDVLPADKLQFKQDGSYQVDYFKSSDLSDDQMNWLLDLTERNIKDYYNQCSWGWSESAKKKELKEKNALFLIIKEKDSGKLIGFTHFRFDWDYDQPKGVVYCYELQIEEKYQGKGIGSFLMELLRLLAVYYKFPKVILTCLKHNKQAIKFYQEKHKFIIDSASPSKFNKNECYEILSLKVNLNNSGNNVI